MQTLARECDYLQSKVTKLEKTNHALVEALEMALAAGRQDWQKGSGWEKKARAALAQLEDTK